MCFVDLEKTYDYFPESVLLGVPLEYGVDAFLLLAIRSLYCRSQSLVLNAARK